MGPLVVYSYKVQGHLQSYNMLWSQITQTDELVPDPSTNIDNRWENIHHTLQT